MLLQAANMSLLCLDSGGSSNSRRLISGTSRFGSVGLRSTTLGGDGRLLMSLARPTEPEASDGGIWYDKTAWSEPMSSSGTSSTVAWYGLGGADRLPLDGVEGANFTDLPSDLDGLSLGGVTGGLGDNLDQSSIPDMRATVRSSALACRLILYDMSPNFWRSIVLTNVNDDVWLSSSWLNKISSRCARSSCATLEIPSSSEL
jgi:hypothetical protein